MFWSHENLASWITKNYLEQQRRRLPINRYLRLHENRWAMESIGIFADSDINRLHSIPWVKQHRATGDPADVYVVSTDLGLRHDRAVRAVGHINRKTEQIFIDNIRIWEGSATNPVDIAAVEKDLIEVGTAFRANRLIVDPWQMEYVIQRLRPFYSVIPFNFQTDMIYLSQVLLNLIRNEKLICYDEPIFDNELRNAESKQTSRGWKIDHGVGGYSDCIVAVGMMALELAKLAMGAGYFVPDVGIQREVGKPHFAGIREQVF